MNVFVVPELAGSLLTKLTILLFLIEKKIVRFGDPFYFNLVLGLFKSLNDFKSGL